MHSYKVTVARSSVQRLVIEVEAKDDNEAMRKAEEVAPDFDFGGMEKEAEYEAEDVSRSDD